MQVSLLVSGPRNPVTDWILRRVRGIGGLARHLLAAIPHGAHGAISSNLLLEVVLDPLRVCGSIKVRPKLLGSIKVTHIEPEVVPGQFLQHPVELLMGLHADDHLKHDFAHVEPRHAVLLEPGVVATVRDEVDHLLELAGEEPVVQLHLLIEV